MTLAGGAFCAVFKTNDVLHRGDVAEAPLAKAVLQIGELFAELVQLPICFGVSVHLEPRGFNFFTFGVGLRPITLQVAGRHLGALKGAELRLTG